VLTGRDQTIDVLFAGERRGRPRPTAERWVALADELRTLAVAYDLTIVLAPADGSDGSDAILATTSDVILCARLGVTPLDWLSRVTGHLRAGQLRLRAVLLWAADGPSM
jgi:hypothetical protein